MKRSVTGSAVFTPKLPRMHYIFDCCDNKIVGPLAHRFQIRTSVQILIGEGSRAWYIDVSVIMKINWVF